MLRMATRMYIATFREFSFSARSIFGFDTLAILLIASLSYGMSVENPADSPMDCLRKVCEISIANRNRNRNRYHIVIVIGTKKYGRTSHNDDLPCVCFSLI